MDPAKLLALQVYFPEWRYDTALIMRREVLEPSWVVVKSGPGPKSSPCRDQVIFKGSSPLMTEQIIWRGSPLFTAVFPNEKSKISGGSKQ